LLSMVPAGVESLCLDELQEDLARQQPHENLGLDFSPEHLAYVIYTSGSTGQPKGSLIPNRSIPGYMFGTEHVDYQRQTILQHSSISWDPLTLELWSSLLRGGRCVMYRESLLNAQDIEEVIQRYGITLLWLPSSLYAAVIDERPQALAGLAQLLIGGDTLSVPHVQRGVECLPQTQLVNGYGPSECTVFSSCYRIPGYLPAHMRSIPIGTAAGDRRLYVLDATMRLVPVGVPGQLYVSGPALARGYLNQPDLTAERFLANPYGDEPGTRMYQTGDLVRWSSAGLLEFLGRVDQQVKIRGFRIEPGEIETALRQQPNVRDAVVLTAERAGGGKELIAYVVVTPGNSLDPAVLQEQLKRDLPAYMVPVGWLILDRLPLNSNGKLDRSALPPVKPVCGNVSLDDGPRDAVERIVWRLWREVLGEAQIKRDSDFFDIGGHSIAAGRAVARANSLFHIRLGIRSIFINSTPASFADEVRRQILISHAALNQTELASLIKGKPSSI
jgi:amino acid adenylation domain-containing protein